MRNRLSLPSLLLTILLIAPACAGIGDSSDLDDPAGHQPPGTETPVAGPRAPSISSPDKHNYQASWDLTVKSDYTLNGTVSGSGKGRLVQGNGSWQIVGPWPRTHHTLVWYPSENCLIAFGGTSYCDTALNDTWYYYPSNDTWVRKAPGPTRYYHTAIWDPADGEMLVFGGTDGKTYQNELWAYRPATDSWSKGTSGATARVMQSAVWDSQSGQMLVFGGWWWSPGTLLNDLWAYKPSTDAWSKLTSGATPRSNHAAVWDQDHDQMLVYAGHVGGAYPMTAMDLWAYYPSNDTWEKKADSGVKMEGISAVWDTSQKRMLVYYGNTYSYSPTTNTWTRLNAYGPSQWGMVAWDPLGAKMYTHAAEAANVWVFTSSLNSWQTRAPAPPYFYHCSVWDDNQDKMLVFGGLTSGSSYTYEVWTYDPASGIWARKADCPDEFERVRAVWDPAGKRVFFAGAGTSNRICNRTWMYDPANDTWTRKADLPLAHYGLSAVWDTRNRQMMVFGGCDVWTGDYWEGVYIYHPQTDKWEWKMQSPAPHARMAHSAVWDESGGRMIMAGGSYYDGTATRYLKDTWSYDPGTNRWTQLADLPGYHAGCAASWDSAHDLMFMLGGYNETSDQLDDLRFDPTANTWTCLTFLFPWSPYFTTVWDRQDNRLLAWGGGGAFGGKVMRAYSMPFVQNGTITSKGFLLSDYLIRIYRVWYNSTVPAGTGLVFQFSTSADNSAWNEWQDLSSGAIPQNQDKYVRWRALLNTSKLLFSPTIEAVRVEYLVNRVPSAMVAAPQTTSRNTEVTLRGIASDVDGDPLAYNWTQTGGPAVLLTNDRFPNASFVPSLPGNYSFSLVLFDGYSYSLPGNATVQALNLAPTVSANASATAYRNETIPLLGSGTDPENDLLIYSWTQVGGLYATIANPHQQNASFIARRLGNHTFRVTASDMYGGLSSADVTVSVINRAPEATVGNDITAFVRSNVHIDGGGLDGDDDELTYAWTMRSGGKVERQGADAASLEFVPLDPVIYSFQRVLSDGYDASPPAIINVSVINRLPAISVGPDLVSEAGQTVLLAGNATDPDGDPLTYRWERSAGPPVTLLDGGTANASFVPLQLGNYSFRLTVSDGHEEVSAILKVTVVKPYLPFNFSSTPPSVGIAGQALTYNITLNDPDTTRTVRLTLEKGPVGMNLTGRRLTWTPKENQTGPHQVSLSATDGHSMIYQNWTLDIKPAPNNGNDGDNPPGPSSGMGWLVPGLMAIVVVSIASALAALIVMRRRRSR